MNKSDLELFKQAINEGLSKRFDRLADSYDGEIVYSESHNLTMRTIVYGKVSKWRSLSPKKRQIIAILVAAALLLTSCAVIFRNELREIINEFFVAITFSDKVSGDNFIEEVYELSYVPKGYVLDEKDVSPLSTSYIYTNENDQVIIFYQFIFDGSSFVIDSEGGYSKMFNVNGNEIYYRDTGERNNYLWSDGKYVLIIKSDESLLLEEIELMIDGIKIK